MRVNMDDGKLRSGMSFNMCLEERRDVRITFSARERVRKTRLAWRQLESRELSLSNPVPL